MSQENVEVVRRGLRSVCQGDRRDLDRFIELCDRDVEMPPSCRTMAASRITVTTECRRMACQDSDRRVRRVLAWSRWTIDAGGDRGHAERVRRDGARVSGVARIELDSDGLSTVRATGRSSR